MDQSTQERETEEGCDFFVGFISEDNKEEIFKEESE